MAVIIAQCAVYGRRTIKDFTKVHLSCYLSKEHKRRRAADGTFRERPSLWYNSRRSAHGGEAVGRGPDAAGVSVWEIVRRTTTHYALPPLFDFVSHFKGLASFPRDPSIQILATLLPSDAIVIGERSNQMLMSLPIRTATTFAANSDPIPVIASILKSEPNATLYALIDSQHAYNLQHYREHAKEYRLRHVKTFKMPSFETGALADVYLAAIEVLPVSSNWP